jgi:lipopolysaccharide export system permease protein
MRILRRYVLGSFMVSFSTAIVVLTLVMSTGIIFRLMDLLARGVSWKSLLLIFVHGLPVSLSFSVPVAVLMSCLLVFGRLSSDGEITAMRASGLNMWQIISPLILAAVPLVLLCLHVNNNVAPYSLYRQRTMVVQLGMESPVQLLEEGRFINDFEGLSLYFSEKKGNVLRNIRIYDVRDPDMKREIIAERGIIRRNEGGDIVIELRKVRVDPIQPGVPGPGFCDSWAVRICADLKAGTMEKRRVYMTRSELKDAEKRIPQMYPGLSKAEFGRLRMSAQVEHNKRIVLALACLTFVLLGAPLGVAAHRKESSIGVAIGLFLVFNFYLFIIVAESISRKVALRPDLLVWLPAAISLAVGAWLTHRVR